MIKIGRGKKQCQNCEAIIAARKKICPSCKHENTPKESTIKKKIRQKRLPKQEPIKLENLSKGDKIIVKQATGPYYINSESEKVYVGFRGKFNVNSITDDGIIAYPYQNKSCGGMCYLYMGETVLSEDTGIVRTPYEILKISE